LPARLLREPAASPLGNAVSVAPFVPALESGSKAVVQLTAQSFPCAHLRIIKDWAGDCK
jgi:hypothetical protein